MKNPKKPKKTQKKPKKPNKTQKNPLGWAFLKKPGFFPTLMQEYHICNRYEYYCQTCSHLHIIYRVSSMQIYWQFIKRGCKFDNTVNLVFNEVNKNSKISN